LFYGSAAISVIKKHIGLYTSLALHCTSTEEWLLSPVYTIQPVVKPVVKPVWQLAEWTVAVHSTRLWLFTR